MLNIRLPESLNQALAEEARQRHTSRSEVARDALAFYLRAKRRQRFMKQMQQAATRLSEVEARDLAEEGLALDNEVLERAEAYTTREDANTPWWQ